MECPGRTFSRQTETRSLAECLHEVFQFAAREGENMASWCSRVQETFAKCRRKVNVEFPSEARGWIALNQSGLSHDQRAVVTARSGGELKFDVVTARLRSCYPEFQVPSRAKRSNPVMLVQNSDTETTEDIPDAGNQVVFSEVEALLAEYRVKTQNTQNRRCLKNLKQSKF